MSAARPPRRRPGEDAGGLPGRLTRHAEPIGTGGTPAREPEPPERHDGDVETIAVRLPRDEPRVTLNVKVPWSRAEGVRLLRIREGRDIQDLAEEALDLLFAKYGFTPPSFWRRG